MNKPLAQASHKSIIPVLSIAISLVSVLTYITFFTASNVYIERAGNTASVVLAQSTAPVQRGGSAPATQTGGSQPASQSGGQQPAVQRARPADPTRSGFENPLGPRNGTLQSFLTTLLRKVIIPLGSIVVIFAIILAGFKYVTAQGDPKAIAEANNQLKWTAIGAAILLGAQVLASVITNTVNTLTS